MTKRALLPLVAALFSLPLLAGCGGAAANAPAVQLASGVANGQPARYQPGAPLGYWVWQDEATKGVWHVRTTTLRQKHTFQGHIHPLAGTRLSDPRTISLGKGDKIGVNGDDIHFSFVTQGDDDGFDFRAEGNACIEFDLNIDGKPHNKLVVVGKGQNTPASSHFLACP